MILNLQSNRLRHFTISVVSRLLAVLILSSFAITQLPIISTSAEDSMPCCAGKSSEHCDSGLTAPKPRPVVTEPMCGLEWSPPPPSSDVQPLTDPVTVESAAVNQDCQMDCGVCVTTASRHKREKSLVATRAEQQAPATVIARFDKSASFHSSNENWNRINPRGPPLRA